MKARAGLTRSIWGNLISGFFLIAMGIFIAFPLYYSIINAFKPVSELFLFPPRFVVYHPTFDNFAGIVRIYSNSLVPIERYIFNTVFNSIAQTLIYMLFASMAAYPLAKKQFPAKQVIYLGIVFAIMFNGDVTALPKYIMLAKLGMLDTYWALILPAIGGTFGVFLMMQFMSTIPDTILEAARIDGAGEKYIFFKIVLPAVKPAVMTLFILTFVAAWNATAGNLVYSEELKMLPTAISQINAGGIMRAGISAAASVIMMIPPIISFLVSQSSVMETMAHSGIKD